MVRPHEGSCGGIGRAWESRFEAKRDPIVERLFDSINRKEVDDGGMGRFRGGIVIRTLNTHAGTIL
jgi:hypothetical protein